MSGQAVPHRHTGQTYPSGWWRDAALRGTSGLFRSVLDFGVRNWQRSAL